MHSSRSTRAPFARSHTGRAIAALLLAGAAGAHAQQGSLPAVTVQGRTAAPVADVTGFGDVPLRDVPVSATVIDRTTLDARGARRLADLTVLDASVTDSYNAPGYWDFLTVRGFTLNNQYNYRREGLPINAQTVIPLDNKERIEILKGTSGIQAGTSAPGGLVNYVVKRPTQQPLRTVKLEATQRGSLLGALDLGGRFGPDHAFGYRFNVAQEQLRPQTRNLDGDRSLASLATDWRLSRDSVVEAEVEWSRKSQPSQAAFSLLGPVLPAPVDPRINLNNQPWSQPSVFEGLTGTLRFEQALGTSWRWSVQAGSQRLRTDDREAFPFGCTAEGNFDRYCSNGTYDLYDFRSEDERRRMDAVSAALKGRVETAGIRHDLSFGLLQSRMRNRFNPQAFNFAGVGNVQGTLVVPASPGAVIPSTNQDERSTELSMADAIRWTERWSTWLGLRHTRLQRDTVMTDGTSPTSYGQSVDTPWAAVSYRVTPAAMVYASWGQGIESQVVPNLPQFANAGQALPAQKSRQLELGVKGGADRLAWQATWFRIHRPISNLDACNRLFIAPCTVASDGEAVHEGLEASAQWQGAVWRVGGSAMVLDAKRRGSVVEPAINGLRPTNVPRVTVRADAAMKVVAVPGLELQGSASHEGDRAVLADNTIALPAWTRFDAAVRYDTRLGGASTSWILGIDNITDRRYWRESPFMFSHVYLYPGQPRTVRLTFTAAL